MVFVFSNKRIEGLDGQYLNEKFYDGNLTGVELIYTDNQDIIKDAKELGIPVKSIKKLLGVEEQTDAGDGDGDAGDGDSDTKKGKKKKAE